VSGRGAQRKLCVAYREGCHQLVVHVNSVSLSRRGGPIGAELKYGIRIRPLAEELEGGARARHVPRAQTTTIDRAHRAPHVSTHIERARTPVS
jgi:hypothetical protein